MAKIKSFILAIASFGIAVSYALPYYQPNNFYSMDYKPFIYRQLSIQGINFLHLFGLRYETSAILFTGVAGVFFSLSLVYLLKATKFTQKPEIVALLSLSVFTFIFQRYMKPYDLATAGFFAWMLALMYERRFGGYLFAFTLSCINRETTIFILPVFVLYFLIYKVKYFWILCGAQILIFGIVQGIIRYALRDVSDGIDMWIVPMHNIQAYLATPMTIIHASLIIVSLWIAYLNWKQKPAILILAFSLLFPIFLFLHLLSGQAFEYRTFAEVYPILASLIAWRKNENIL